MSEFMLNDFNKVINERHSVSHFDPEFKISHEELEQMIDEAVTAPSAVNMQPWRAVVAESDEIRETLKPLVRFNTGQLASASSIVFFFADKQSPEKIDETYNRAVDEGKMPAEIRDYQLPAIHQMYENLSDQELRESYILDTSLAIMQFMLVARAHGYETNPMSGFEHAEAAVALGMDSDRYIPVLMVAIGKAAADGHESVRFDAHTITEYR